MEDSVVIERILDRIDKFDDKLDTNIGELKEDITDCKLDIQKVQSDLTNHLDNKKSETEKSNRKFYYITGLLGIIFTAYATIKEFLA